MSITDTVCILLTNIHSNHAQTQVRKDTETQCRIVFGSLDEKRKKSKRAHRPYELLFDSPNELKRFLHSLQVVRESAPKRGMSVMKMERLGSFMNLENSMFGMWCSSA